MRIEWMEKYLKEAETLIYDNQVEAGLNLLNDLLYEEPGYGGLHNYLGWAYMYYTIDLKKAELHLRMAISFDKEYPAPYLHLGNLFIRMQRYDEAMDFFEQGMTKPDANRVVFLESIGHVYEMKRMFTQAIKVYKEAILSSAGFEMNNLTERVKRCQKKRLMYYFTF